MPHYGTVLPPLIYARILHMLILIINRHEYDVQRNVTWHVL